METLLAPLTGLAVSLDQVPDDVFSRKLLGDGVAILPTEGRLLSPADGEVIAVFHTGHAYCLRTGSGLELLIHVGLESISLKGEGVVSHVAPGDRVKAGDLLAQVDLTLLESRGIPTVTPVVVCTAPASGTLHTHTGPVAAGETAIITIS